MGTLVGRARTWPDYLPDTVTAGILVGRARSEGDCLCGLGVPGAWCQHTGGYDWVPEQLAVGNSGA